MLYVLQGELDMVVGGEPLTLDRLAQDLQYGKSCLCGTFKKDTGTTIVDCLNTIRIRHAADLLAYSDIDIAQVSQLCGFASPNNFSRVFQKYVGVNPRQCRRSVPGNILDFKKSEGHQTNSLMYWSAAVFVRCRPGHLL